MSSLTEGVVVSSAYFTAVKEAMDAREKLVKLVSCIGHVQRYSQMYPDDRNLQHISGLLSQGVAESQA